MAKKNQDTQTDQPEAKAEADELYSLTFGDAPTTPAELYVTLPKSGGKVYMAKHYKGEAGGDGWPYAEVRLTKTEAAHFTREFAMHGLILKPIGSSALKAHPLATPQAPE